MKSFRNVVRGVVAMVNSATRIQALQMRLTAGEVKDGMEHFEAYGFTSSPQAGAEGLAVFLGGDRSHGVVVVVGDRRFRLKGLMSGEVAMYTDEGDFLHFKRGRVIEIETATLRIKASEVVEIDTPLIRTTGRIESAGDQRANGVSTHDHVHEGSDKPPVAGG